MYAHEYRRKLVFSGTKGLFSKSEKKQGFGRNRLLMVTLWIVAFILSFSVKAADLIDEKEHTFKTKQLRGEGFDFDPKVNENQNLIKNQQVAFEENKGQISDVNGRPVTTVFYRLHTGNNQIYVTDKGLTFVFSKPKKQQICDHKYHEKNPHSAQQSDYTDVEMTWVNLHLANAHISKDKVWAESPLADEKNYYLGHCSEGITGVQSFKKITFQNVYPGIDWVLYNADAEGLKYDFVVHPQANAQQIKLMYESEKGIELKNGELNINHRWGTLIEKAPYSYEQKSKKKINSSIILNKRSNHIAEIAFETDALISSETIVIDPQIVWGTFFGGLNSYEDPRSVLKNSQNAIYLVGNTHALAFPLVNAPGHYYQSVIASYDIFISKFSNSGVLQWSTLYGGNSSDNVSRAHIDENDQLFIVGLAFSSNFPLQNAGGYFNSTPSVGFVLRFNTGGVRTWATFFPGYTNSINTDSNGNIFIVGFIEANNLPFVNAGGYFDNSIEGLRDGFIARFNASTQLTWSTMVGGNQLDNFLALDLDSNGNIFIIGNTSSTNFPLLANGGYQQTSKQASDDVIIIKFLASTQLAWSTYYGGNNYDQARDILVNSSGVYAVMMTTSTNLSTQNSGGYFQSSATISNDIFLIRFSLNGVRQWATYYGGNDLDALGSTIHLKEDNCGNIFIATITQSTNIQRQAPPCNVGYFRNNFSGGPSWHCDAFIIKFNAFDELTYATYIHGNGDEHNSILEVDHLGNIFIVFTTDASNQGVYQMINPGNGAFHSNTNSNNSGRRMVFYKLANDANPTYTQSQVNPTGCNCNGSATVTLQCAERRYSYRWSTGAQTLNSTSTTNTLSNLCPGTYWVEVNSNCNQIDTVYFTLSGAGGGIVINQSTTQASCSSPTGSVTIQSISGAPGPYTLSLNGNAVASGITPPYTLSNLAPGNYSYLLTAANGCTQNLSVQISALPNLPQVSISPPAGLTCATGQITLSGSSSTTGATALWSGPGIVSGANGFSPVVNQPGIYTIAVTNPTNGCSNTASVSVVANTTAPNLQISPPPVLTCTQTQVSLSASSSVSGLTAQWSGPGIVSGATTLSPLVNQIGNYQITITNPSNGCSASGQISVTQNVQPPDVNITTPPSITCSHSSVQLQASSSVNGATAQWMGPGLLSGVNSLSPVVHQAGIYQLTLTNPQNGCSNQASVTVVADTISPSLILAAPPALTCSATQINLQVSTSTANTAAVWTGPGIVSGAQGLNPLINQPGSYTVSLTNSANGCTRQASVSVPIDTVSPVLQAYPVLPLTCSESSTTLSVNSSLTNLSYVWSGNGLVGTPQQSQVTVQQTGIYTVTATSPVNGCSSSLSLSVTADTASPVIQVMSPVLLTCAEPQKNLTCNSSNSSLAFLWTGPSIVSGATTSSPLVGAAGTYSVTATDLSNGCSRSATVQVNALAALQADVSLLQGLRCQGDTNAQLAFQLSGGMAPYFTLWQGDSVQVTAQPFVLSGLGAGSYSFQFSDHYGCSVSVSYTVNAPAPLQMQVWGDTVICSGQNTTLSLSASGGIAPYHFQWNHVPGSNSSLSLSPLVTTLYPITLTDANFCQTLSEVTVVVNPLPVVDFTHQIIGECIPVCVSFQPNGNFASYLWNFGNSETSAASSPISCFKVPGYYSVSLTVTDQNQCSNSLAYDSLVYVLPLPKAQFNYFPKNPDFLNPTVNFTNLSQNAHTFFWDLGNGNFSQDEHPNTDYTQVGEVEVWLVAYNENGCADTAHARLKVGDLFNVYAPNSFTPNGDGINDVWMLSGIGIDENRFHLMVFNRWGELIFESRNPEDGWDGTYQGKLAPNEVFNWKAHVAPKDNNLGMPKEYLGKVFLVK